MTLPSYEALIGLALLAGGLAILIWWVWREQKRKPPAPLYTETPEPELRPINVLGYFAIPYKTEQITYAITYEVRKGILSVFPVNTTENLHLPPEEAAQEWIDNSPQEIRPIPWTSPLTLMPAQFGLNTNNFKLDYSPKEPEEEDTSPDALS